MASGIVVDTSALIAVIAGEADAEMFAAKLLEHAGDVAISGPTLVEATIVADARFGRPGIELIRITLERVGGTVAAFDESLARTASNAWQRFGKGRHPARLNLGDCFSYALAKHLGLPLLYKGADFSQTDVASAL